MSPPFAILGPACVALLAAGCSDPSAGRAGAGSGAAMDAAPRSSAPVVDAAVAPLAPDAAATAGKAGTMRISIDPPRQRGHAIAARCALEGDPLDGDYSHARLSIAAASDGALYVADSAGVRRYRAKAGAPCALAIDASFGSAGVLAIPEIEPPPQTVGGGALYFQSGGRNWALAAGPRGTVYLHDLLRGVRRVDRGKVEATCPALQGVMSLVFVGQQAYIERNGGERLAIGSCKTTPARLKPASPRTLHGAGGALWGEIDSDTLVRYGGSGTQTTIESLDAFEPGGFCTITALAGCGDGLCVVDSNCIKIARYDLTGSFVRELDGAILFDDRPTSITGAATAADGALWIAATHKDGEHVEGAIYLVPTAAM